MCADTKQEAQVKIWYFRNLPQNCSAGIFKTATFVFKRSGTAEIYAVEMHVRISKEEHGIHARNVRIAAHFSSVLDRTHLATRVANKRNSKLTPYPLTLRGATKGLSNL